METEDLARALAAHPRFRWEPGMVDQKGFRCVFGAAEAGGHATGVCIEDDPDKHSGTYAFLTTDLPDLSDPATAGVLLSWLGLATVHLSFGCDPIVQTGQAHYSGDTLGEAVARALLAQWGVDQGAGTPSTLNALTRALVAHRRWTWALGMTLVSGESISAAEIVDGQVVYYAGPTRRPVTALDLPDLSCGQTIGVLTGWLGPFKALSTEQGHEITTRTGVFGGSTLGEVVARALLDFWV